MSRIGKQPVKIPKGVEVKVDKRRVSVKGPKGELKMEHADLVSVTMAEGQAEVKRVNDTKDARARHGLVRSLLQNMVIGVTEGYKRNLEIFGVGYKAQVQGQKIIFSLGFSHPVNTLRQNISNPLPKALPCAW